MSVRRLSPNQPTEEFRFSEENLKWAEAQLKKFPEGRQQSAIIPFLWRAQVQNGGWITKPIITYIADWLDMAEIRIYEVVTFYTMFNLEPVGEHLIQVCTTTPCWLRGSDDLVKVCKNKIAEKAQTLSEDGKFSWMEVECLGACSNAPMIQIGDDYYEDLDEKSMEDIIDRLARGEEVKPDSQIGRASSEPAGGLTSLTDESLYAGQPSGGES
jgi:NADH-quinone oxidoreductase subunit E